MLKSYKRGTLTFIHFSSGNYFSDTQDYTKGSNHRIHTKLLLVCVLWHIKLCRLFNDKSILYKKAVLFQTIQYNII